MNLLDAEDQAARPDEHIEVTQSLCARDATLDCEDDAEFNRLLAGLRQEHQPSGLTEDYFVQQMAAAYWKSRRLTRFETGVLAHQSDRTVMIGLSDYRPPIEPTPHAVRDHETMTLGMAVYEDCNSGNVIVKLTNCASIVDRGFQRSLQQLQRLQAARKPAVSQPVPKAA
jgi:hypothetical protein